MDDKKSEVRKNIIELFEIDKLDEDKQEEMIGRIGKIIFQSVLVRVLPQMQKDDVVLFEKMMDEDKSPEEIFDFLFTKVPELIKIISEESEKFRNETTEILRKI